MWQQLIDTQSLSRFIYGQPCAKKEKGGSISDTMGPESGLILDIGESHGENR
jgi:hypothetical protein